ncbi:uncharacterized protein KD926_006335 [Aspergillus affinis]|uniref:uncharacterized protein n=1 Tax=Aspergillus affinis TaxID=1070780 RepID=UPI0022FEFA7A|nr:uncharacterized protein KD926_006335 [Aspergillus affinis]KAI9041998.1 hypothetical protein KD926_006335 [Aspergillus affinis]
MKFTQILFTSAFATACLAFDTSATEGIKEDYDILGEWNYGLQSGTFDSDNLGEAMIAEAVKLVDPVKIEDALKIESQNSAGECSALAEASEGFAHRLSDLFHNIEDPKVLCEASFQSKIEQFGSTIVLHPHIIEVVEVTLKRDCDADADDVKAALEAFPQAFSNFDAFLTALSDANATCSGN